MRVALVLMAVVMSLFAGRLVQLQGLDAQAYAQKAQSGRMHTVTLAARRGAITDRDGVPLARSLNARQVTADPTMIEHPREVAARLSPLLDRDEATLVDRLTADGRYSLLADGLTPRQGREVAALELTGVFTVPTHDRVYPANKVAANVVGFVGSDGTALGGLEYAMDDRLEGEDGDRTYERAADGRPIPTGVKAGHAPVPGQTVRLTIDRDVQWAAQSAIARQVREAKAEWGSVVVMEASTGRLLALATSPTFNPNDPGAASVRNRGNRVVSAAYEPGSTGKVMTAAAAIESGAVRPGTELTVPPTLPREGKAFSDSDPHGTLRLTFTGVLAKSSNIGTMLAAERTGFRRVYRELRDFGIGEPAGRLVPGASTGYLPEPSGWSGTTPYTMMFGQGYSATAVQMASVFATIANDGVRVEPSVIEGYVGRRGKFSPAPEPRRQRVVSAQTARQVSRMLEMVVSDAGTAPDVAIPGYRVAGKTGTAQRAVPECHCYQGYTASFIGFAPADRAGLVVGVTLQDPQRGRYGGQLAGPVFTEVMSFALKSERIRPTGSAAPRLRIEGRGPVASRRAQTR